MPTDNSQAGTYEVIIMVEDSDSEGSGTFLTAQQSFTVTIIEVEKLKNDYTVNGFDYSSLIGDINLKPENERPELLIKEISNFGEVTLEWTQDIFFLDQMNYAIEGGALDFFITTEYNVYEPEEVFVNFKVTQIRDREIELILNLTKPEVISAF